MILVDDASHPDFPIKSVSIGSKSRHSGHWTFTNSIHMYNLEVRVFLRDFEEEFQGAEHSNSHQIGLNSHDQHSPDSPLLP